MMNRLFLRMLVSGVLCGVVAETKISKNECTVLLPFLTCSQAIAWSDLNLALMLYFSFIMRRVAFEIDSPIIYRENL